MTLITLKEFAKLKKVSVQAVRAKGFKTVKKYGKELISDKTDYTPRALPGKRATKK